MAGDLAAALAVFDVAALETLANKGLVRRALRDVEEGKVVLGVGDGTTASVTADGETVSMDRRGPAHAICSCPAPGLCRHRIAATLFLQTAGDAPSGAPVEAIDHAAALKAEIAALDAAVLAKWAGKAAWRGAVELAGEGGTVAVEGSALVIGVTDEAVRYLAGQGLAGMVSKAKPAKAKAVHTAAMLLARQFFELETIVEEAQSDAPTEERQVDPAFLTEIHRVLAQCARLALNLAPVALEDQLFILSVSSRADHLPRLSRMLRTLSTMLRDRRKREFSFDPDRCLALVAEAFALSGALGQAGNLEDQGRAGALCGSIRQGYVPAEAPLLLTGMGGDVWRTQSGARGVTIHLHDAAADRWFSASLARGPGQDPGFDPVFAYGRDAIWQGYTLQRLSRSAFALEGAALSPDGRLSMAATARAIDPVETVIPEGVAVTRWDELRDRLRGTLADAIDAPHVAVQPVLIHPRRVARPWFDDLRQELVWPVEDDDGVWMGLAVEQGRDRDALIHALEAVAERGWRGTITALASIGDRSFALKPFALRDGATVFNLGLDDVGALTKFGMMTAATGFVRDFGTFFGRIPRNFEPAAPPVARRELTAAWKVLVDLAELGMTGLSADQVQRLGRASGTLGNIGLSVIAKSVQKIGTSRVEQRWHALLAAAFALHQARRRTLDLPLLVRC
jgi:hypothetical protein